MTSLVSLVATASGLSRMLQTHRRRRFGPHIHILAYHDVAGGGEESEGVISSERFRRHVRRLKRRFTLHTVSEAADLLEQPGRLTSDRAVVTFDDGWAGNYEWAWPILREEQVPATIFLTTGFLDSGELWFDAARRGFRAALRPDVALPPSTHDLLTRIFGRWPSGLDSESRLDRLKYVPIDLRNEALDALRELKPDSGGPARALSWKQVREMEAAGIEMGAHSVTHPILSMLSPDGQESEISDSRRRIEQETGKAPTCFAMPNGSARDFDPATLEILGAQGFRAACTMIRGPNRPGCDLLTLRRIGVGSDPGFVLEARLAGLFDEGVRRRLRKRRLLHPFGQFDV
jgi:peptidoglycan/xylan/chitin deacetylase (PgdA/CDA1 family)